MIGRSHYSPLGASRASSRTKQPKQAEATAAQARSHEDALPPGLGGVSRTSGDTRIRTNASLANDPVRLPRKKRFKASSSPSCNENAGAVSRGAALPPHLQQNGTSGAEASAPSDGRARPPSPRRVMQSVATPPDTSTRATLPTVKGKQKMGREMDASATSATAASGQSAKGGGGGGGHGPPANEQVPYVVAVAKLRLYLAACMLQAVRSSPNGGFGIPIPYVIRNMSTEFGSDLVESLFHDATHTNVIFNECGDIVEIIPLTVGQTVKNGCVPSTLFRRDSTNIEARIRQDSITVIARAEGSAQATEFEMKVQRRMAMDFFQQAGDTETVTNATSLETPSRPPPQQGGEALENSTQPQKELMPATALYEMVKRLMETVVQEILANPMQFPTIPQFSERFRREYGVELNPRVAGFTSVLEMLQEMDLYDLICFRKYHGNVFIVPTSRAHSARIVENPVAGEDRMVEDGGGGGPCSNKASRDMEKTLRSLPAASQPQSITTPADIPPPPPPPPEGGSIPRVGHSITERKEHESVGLTRHGEGPMDITSPALESVQGVSEGQQQQQQVSDQLAFHADEFDEFDAEILNKLRSLFAKTICKDQKPICLNRLPLIFLRHCGSVLDYQKYGYINLTDVVSLLSDIVKVVDTSRGKYIVSVDRPARKILPVSSAAAMSLSVPSFEEEALLQTIPQTGAAFVKPPDVSMRVSEGQHTHQQSTTDLGPWLAVSHSPPVHPSHRGSAAAAQHASQLSTGQLPMATVGPAASSETPLEPPVFNPHFSA